uniref:Uncharacterized protein n=1 Tax=Megaselia scalaris TaxID=36166 RepID=T1GJ07_MEGSC
MAATERTNETFRGRSDPLHHTTSPNEICPLERLNIDMHPSLLSLPIKRSKIRKQETSLAHRSVTPTLEETLENYARILDETSPEEDFSTCNFGASGSSNEKEENY